MFRIAFAGLALALAMPAFAAGDDAVARLSGYDDAVIATMKAGLPFATRVQRFEGLVRTYYDMPGIAALVVGPAWTSASAADRAGAIAALTHHSAVSLARNFASYGGEKFVIDPAVTARGSSRIVKVTISSGGSRNVLLYRVDGGRIVDVVADGVSQLAVQKADLASTVANGGAAGLARRLAQVDAKAK